MCFASSCRPSMSIICLIRLKGLVDSPRNSDRVIIKPAFLLELKKLLRLKSSCISDEERDMVHIHPELVVFVDEASHCVVNEVTKTAFDG